MFFETETVEHEHIQSLQCVERRAWNLAEICQISKVVEAITHDGQTSVNHFQRRDQQVLPHAETRTRRHHIRNHFRQTTPEMRRLKDVLEDALDIDPRAFICKNAERAKTKVQRPDIVETEDV